MNPILIIAIAIAAFVYGMLLYQRLRNNAVPDNVIFVDVDSTEWHFKWIAETIGRYKPAQMGLTIETRLKTIKAGGFSINIRSRQNKEARRLWEYLCQTNVNIDHTLIHVYDPKGEKVDTREFFNRDCSTGALK